jgi:hypothetical protein
MDRLQVAVTGGSKLQPARADETEWNLGIDGFQQRQVAFPARFWWSRFACLWSKAKTSFLVDFGPALILFCDLAMPTVNWEECLQSYHYDHYSLERFLMSQTIDNLQMLLLLLNSNSANGDSSGINAIILTLLTIMNFDDDLHRLRPSNFYPPEGFYPTGCHDDFWDRSDAVAEMFLMRFRFRVPHFHRLMTAMSLDGKAFTIGGKPGHRFR